MKAKFLGFLGTFLVFCIISSCIITATASGGPIYLAKITSITALYDEHLERVEFAFETTGTLYHEQSFTVSVTCSALEEGKWVANTLISTSFFGFDGCVIRGNVVEGEVSLSKSLFTDPRYKDFLLTVKGERVDMGDMVEGDYYDLDAKSELITIKPEPTGDFFELGAKVSAPKIATGGGFSYKVYPEKITRNLSGGLSHFEFTLNYDPSVMRLEKVEYYCPRGTKWAIKNYGFVDMGYSVSLEGEGVKDDAEVYVVFHFVSLAPTKNTELYALDVGGGDSYGHNYKAPTYVLLPESPIVEDTALGDLNADDCMDSLDAAIALKYDAGLLSAAANSGDVNADGYIDSLDAAIILKYDAGLLDSIG